MGQRHRSLITESSAFFVSAATLNHIDIFLGKNLKIANDTLLEVFETKRIRLLAYVVMSSHIHFVAWFFGGGPELSRLMISLKGLIRERTVGSRKIWTHRFDDVMLRDEKDLYNTIEYIHRNPVDAGIVEKPTDYRFSSARVWAGLEKDKRIWTNIGTISATEEDLKEIRNRQTTVNIK